MLNYCQAYLIAGDPVRERTLHKLAHRVGFGRVCSLLKGDSLPLDCAVTYLLVDSHLADDAKRSLLSQFRAHELDTMRYAPIVLINEDGPYEEVLRYIAMGFDDVIALPDKSDLLTSRLGAQLSDEIVYYETDTYLGPDRRRMEIRPLDRDSRRTGVSPYSRLVIRRDPIRGISLVRRELLGQPTRTPSEMRSYMTPRPVTIF